MKNRSIKFDIIINFIISGIFTFLLTGILFIGGFAILHIYSDQCYIDFLNLYNNNMKVMTSFNLSLLVISIINMFFIFIKRMSKLTDYIGEISDILCEISTGNMDIQVPIRMNNEIGLLAQEVNSMAYNLNNLMQKEREWDNQRSILITNLSHDLKTPLTSILGFLQLIKRNIPKLDVEILNKYCDISLEKCEELNLLIRKLFEFTKLNNRDLKLDKSDLILNEFIEQVSMGFIPDFIENDMEFNINSKEKIVINADPDLMRRVFENILSNAIKYTSDGKKLNIIIKKELEDAIIIFENYGPDINEKNVGNLFDRFYRIEKTCDKREGTGVGLSIVKMILDKHKGSISVLSSKEKTQFIIRLPLQI